MVLNTQILSVDVSSNQILSYAKALAEGQVPKSEHPTQIDWRRRGADVDIVVGKILAHFVKTSWSGLRRHIYDVYMSGSWQEARLQMRNALGRPTDEWVPRFRKFEEWFNNITVDLDDTYRSTLWSNCTVVLPALTNHEIALPNGLTLDKVFDMDESKWQMLASPAKNIVKQLNQGVPNAGEKLGRVVEQATTSTSKRQLAQTWKEQGLIGGATPVLGYMVMLDNKPVYIITPQNDEEDKRVKMQLSYAVQVNILDMTGVRALFSEVNEPDEHEISEFLSGQ